MAFQGLLKSLKMTQALEILGKVFEFMLVVLEIGEDIAGHKRSNMNIWQSALFAWYAVCKILEKALLGYWLLPANHFKRMIYGI